MFGNFHFDLDVEVFQKSGEGDKDRRIAGFVTTDDLDQQGEKLVQTGLDFEHFLTKGWFNDNHSRETTGIVGYPETAELRKKGDRQGWYVEGYLLKGTKRADEIWELANALQKSGRRLGFSVEGQIHERSGSGSKTIAKATVKNVAITNCPVNDKTSLEVLAKSLDSLDKALQMGPAQPGGPTPGEAIPGHGATLAPESLETSKRKKRKKKTKTLALDSSVEGGLTKAEGVAFLLALRPTLTVAAAERVYAHAVAQRRP